MTDSLSDVHFEMLFKARIAEVRLNKSKEVQVEINGIVVGIDLDIVELVVMMNKFPGIETYESCSGHGTDTIRIFFRPSSFEALPDFLYYISSCHSGMQGWHVEVYTTCTGDGPFFRLESTAMGDAAYDEANNIAAAMKKEFEEEVIE